MWNWDRQQRLVFVGLQFDGSGYEYGAPDKVTASTILSRR